jgi:sulfate transport system ATP-binding protein
VLLLDEPFGSLDARVRQELRRWLRRLHDEIRLTSVFVTHDQEEALEVADRVVVMNQGRIEQIGSPKEVFDRPATPFVMGFLGNVNVFHGRVENGRAHLGPLAVDYPGHPHGSAVAASGYARPHELEVARDEGRGGGFWATLTHIHAAGSVVRLELAHDVDRVVQVETSHESLGSLSAEIGDRLYVRPRNIRVFVRPDQVPPQASPTDILEP